MLFNDMLFKAKSINVILITYFNFIIEFQMDFPKV